MKVSAELYRKMPSDLQALFEKCPNPSRDEVERLFPGDRPGFSGGGTNGAGFRSKYVGGDKQEKTLPAQTFNDTGSAARFFQACPDTDPEDAQARLVYCAKASKRDRDEGLPPGVRSTHPTVKPTSLMRYLCRLITPPGGVVLDPFMGSGSTGKACGLEGFQFIGIEQSPEYMPIASARVAFGYGTPAPAPEPAPAPPEPAQEGQLSLFG